MSDETKSGIKYLDMADEHLDGITDPTLLILKTHLLLEQALRAEVAANVRHPRFLKQANLRFYQVLNLAKAMFYESMDNEDRARDIDQIWDAVEALNALRNQLAHHLEPDDTARLLQRFFLVSPYEGQSLDHPDVRYFIYQSFGFLVAHIWSLSAQSGGPAKKNSN